jgi:hypothetical protein
VADRAGVMDWPDAIVIGCIVIVGAWFIVRSS